MHEPVLLEAALDRLAIRPGGTYVDGTLGGAGHARAILERSAPDGRLIGLDRDPEALARAAEALRGYGRRAELVRANFADLAEVAAGRGIASVDGVLLDIGVSSDQLDTARRGFSFRMEGPLDMRMDPDSGRPAADVVNTATEEDLTDLFRTYGEEPHARAAARAIARAREVARIETTSQLAEIVRPACGRGWRGGVDPATRVFQALRIEVNGELDALRRGLPAALGLLKPGGRLAVIAFHSLEDRIVKDFFRRHAGREEALQAGGSVWVAEAPEVRLITRKAVTAAPDEMDRNPRARSAKLRVAERKD